MPRAKKTSYSSRPPRGGLAAQVAAAKEGLASVSTKARRSRSGTPRRSRAKTAAEPAADGAVPNPVVSAHSRGKLGQLFGFSVVSCIKAAGKDGATYEEVASSLFAMKVRAKENTIKHNIRLGRNGGEKAGKVASLTREQLNQIRGQAVIPGTEGVDVK